MANRSVLVATDFSPAADLALEAAILWAEHVDAELRLVHALDTWKSSIEDAASALGERARRESATGRDWSAELRCRAGAPPHPEDVLQSSPDWVVHGVSGAPGRRGLGAGSWSEGLIRSAPCPVISVPEGARLEKELSTIVVGLDGSAQSTLVHEQLHTLGAHLGCQRFVLVHAHGETGPAPGIAATLDTLLASTRAAGYRGDLVCAPERSSDLVLRVAREEGAALVAVGTHSKRGFPHLLFGSVAKAVVRGATCPVYSARWATRSSDRV